ncbi:MAG: hypothetical protein K2W97_01785 [Chthoniobacterales bacterium]|nr:hypothetical protein [Chthoniobacterales bacterium]
MISHTTADFQSCYEILSSHLRLLARKQYLLWKSNPFHPSLQFKKVGPKLWSCRVNAACRALATPIPNGYVWIWIGSHDNYMKMIRSIY